MTIESKHVLMATILMSLLCGTASAAWLDGYNYRIPINITGELNGSQTNYTLQLNATYDASMQIDYDDLRFANADGTTLVDAWLESNTSDYALTWVEFPTTPASGVNQTYYLYFGNASVSSDWNGTNTFIAWHGVATTDFLDPLIVPHSTSYVWEGKIKPTASTHNVLWGLADDAEMAQDGSSVQSYSADPHRYFTQRQDGSATTISESTQLTPNQYYKGKIVFDTTTARGYIDDDEIANGITTNFPNSDMGLLMWAPGGACAQDWSFVRKYVANPPTYEFGSKESFDTVPPQWGNQSQNTSSIQQGGDVLLSANAQDSIGLNYAWLSTNETGIWQNFTDVDATTDDYQMLTHLYVSTQSCCGSNRFTTGYSQVTGDYSKILYHHTPTGAVGQILGYGWYYIANNTWNSNFTVMDSEDADADSLIVCNDTHWMSSYRTLPGTNLYRRWSSDSGATWGGAIVSPFNGITGTVSYIQIDNDTTKVWVHWVPTSDSTHVHQKFFYLENESFGTETIAWTLSSNDETIFSNILHLNGTYYAYTCANTGYAQYRTSTNCINWSASISTGVPRYSGWGYGVDCDDNYCYMTLQHTDRSTRLYSIPIELINTTNWTYRLDLNVANGGIPSVKIINNTHIITSQQENTAQIQYGMLVKTHTITSSMYDSPIKFSGSTDWEYANFTWSNSDYSDTTIGWKICFNDTFGMTNCTDVMTFDIKIFNSIVIGANKYGMLRKEVDSAQTFSTIAYGFIHDVCFTWWNSTNDKWESYWVGDSYNSAESVPEHDSYFVLSDGTGETVSCSVAPAESVTIPTGWSVTYLRENTMKTLTQIKTDMQVDGTVTNLYAWNHTATGTGAWVSVDVTPTYSVLPNQGILVNNGGAQYNWDGTVS